MNWEAIGAIGELAGATAVIISLLYLANQIRHSRLEAQAASRDSMSKSTIDILMRIAADSEMLELFLAGMSEPETLDEAQTMRFDMMFYSIFESWETVFSQWKRGTLSDEDWTKWEAIISNYFATPGIVAFWARLSAQFSPSFCEYIDTLERKVNYSFADRASGLRGGGGAPRGPGDA